MAAVNFVGVWKDNRSLALCQFLCLFELGQKLETTSYLNCETYWINKQQQKYKETRYSVAKKLSFIWKLLGLKS